MSLSPSELRLCAQVALWGLLLGFACWWLRGTLTPAKFLSLFESEGVLSIRLVLAAVVVVFTLCMEAGGRLALAMVEANFFLAGTLLGLGTAKLVGKAFASRPPSPPTQIKTDKANVDVAGDANFSTAKTE
jgi:hypothetical protein